MTELNEQILELIKKDVNINKISEITGLSNKQLYYRLSLLKLKGYDFYQRYYSNGDITYKLIKELDNEEYNNKVIRTDKTITQLKIMFISDLHFGNKLERLDLLYNIYDYCIKENINIIVNAGDLIDGKIGGEQNKNIIELNKQIEYLIKNYPFDKNILNFICLGNHDIDSLTNEGLDISKVLLNRRHDLIPLGYGLGKIIIKDDHIYVVHPTVINLGSLSDEIVFHGHHHKMKTINNTNSTIIHIPSLSDLSLKNSILPGFIIGTLKFNDGLINYFNVENYIFNTDNKIYKVGENEFYRNINKKKIKLKEI